MAPRFSAKRPFRSAYALVQLRRALWFGRAYPVTQKTGLLA